MERGWRRWNKVGGEREKERRGGEGETTEEKERK